ncbi:MAG: DUF362 domain-containing protein [Gammaproteobacteria bacterium]|nr:DUF362 domain-containing protein [Gammaproteobacteria bacterium]
MSKVYFIKEVSSEALLKIYDKLNVNLKGNVAVKLSSGEPGGHNFLNAQMIEPLVTKVNGTIVECNTSYGGKRFHTKDHEHVLEKHGFKAIAKTDILDKDADMPLPVKIGNHLKENFVGKGLENYDSILMFSHFKGHIMAGFGGALKNMSIGLASSEGKCFIHSAGASKDSKAFWSHRIPRPTQEEWIESMAEACESVMDYMGRENIVYINVANNLSVDCDCDSNPEKPCMEDIGIFASLDPVAVDQACIDAVFNSNDKGRDHMVERIDSRHGRHILGYAESIGIGSTKYELEEIK